MTSKMHVPAKKPVQKPCRKRTMEWFVEPTRDVARANDMIFDFLGDPDVRVMKEMKDDHGKSRNVWSCTFAQAKNLWASRATLGIAFDLWGRDRNYGSISYKTFLLR